MWSTAPLRPSSSRVTMSAVTSPVTLIMSEPEAADDPVGHPVGGRLDEELVVAFQAVHLHHFDGGVLDVQAGAEDALVRDGEVVRELGAQDDQLVEAGAAVHVDGGVDVVLDLVLAAAGPDVQRPGGGEAQADHGHGHAVGVQRDDVVFPHGVVEVTAGAGQVVEGGVGVGVVADAVAVAVVAGVAAADDAGAERHRGGEGAACGHEGDVAKAAAGDAVRVGVADRGDGEGADDEDVVVVVAVELDLGLVGVDGELVVAGAAGGQQRGVRAGAEPAARGGHQCREGVRRKEGAAVGRVLSVALGSEDLADLEDVVAGAAVQGDGGGRVVHVEGVVAALAEDCDAAVEGGVVVDPLDQGAGLIAGDPVAVGADAAVAGEAAGQKRHEGRVVRRLRRAEAAAGDACAERERALVVDALQGPQQEDVVRGRIGGGARQVAVVGGRGVVVAVDGELVHAGIRGSRVQDVDDVVADVAVAAVGVDEVVVGLALAVQGEGVPGAGAELQGRWGW